MTDAVIARALDLLARHGSATPAELGEAAYGADSHHKPQVWARPGGRLGHALVARGLVIAAASPVHGRLFFWPTAAGARWLARSSRALEEAER